MRREDAMVPWCVRIKYVGAEAEFLFGTVVLPRSAQTHEVEHAIRAERARLYPKGFTFPAEAEFTPIRGGVFFTPASD